MTIGSRIRFLLLVLITSLSTGRAGGDAATDGALRDEVLKVVNQPPTGQKALICQELDGLKYRIESRDGGIPAELVVPLASLTVLRCSRGCCTPCVPNAPCARVTCDSLVERFSKQLLEYESCQGSCTRKNQLADDIALTFVDLVKKCPARDEQVTWALSRVRILAAPKEIVARALDLLARGSVDPTDAIDLLEKILTLDDDKIRAAALRELTSMAHALAERGGAVAEEEIRQLFAAASKLLSSRLSAGALEDASSLIARLDSDLRVQRMVELLALARELEDNGEQVGKALDIVIARHPELRKHDRPHMSPSARLSAVISYLNSTHLKELRQTREAISYWRAIEGQRRLRLKVSVTLGPCLKGATGPKCDAANEFKSGFVRVLKELWPQSADEIDPDDPVPETFEQAKAGLGDDSERCRALASKTKTHAALCTAGPYLGYVGLNIDDENSTATSYWAVRTLNDVVESCSTGNGTCPRTRLGGRSGWKEGETLAIETLKGSGIAKLGGVIFRDPDPPSEFETIWKKVGRPIALVGALGLVTSGVYMSNTRPESSSGDWLWRAGLGVSVLEIGAEAWLYFE